MTQDKTEQSNFGFKKVGKAVKQGLVNEVFSSVASKYDLMNDIASLGVHRLWKKEFISKIPNLNAKIIDIASGSGDIALLLKERARKVEKTPEIVLCDINKDMLEIAKSRAVDKNLFQGLEYLVANAEELPFADNSFDYYTIAFGIRNVTNINKALKEAYRVLKPMGKFLCLEFSSVTSNNLKALYQFYSFNILPQIGKIVTGKREAYDYLVESIKLFPGQENFKVMITEAGFKEVNYQNLSFGIAAIHSGYKLN